MKDPVERLAEARLEERIARARWFDTLDEFQDKATPGGIAEEVWDGIQQGLSETAGKAVHAAKERPFVTAAAGAAIALLAFRRPIAAAIGKRIARHKETQGPDEALNEKPNLPAV